MNIGLLQSVEEELRKKGFDALRAELGVGYYKGERIKRGDDQIGR